MAKNTLLGSIGVVGATISAFWGGLGIGLQTLLIFMCLDYITGLVVAGFFQNSPKSDKGGLDSKAGFQGLIKKSMILFTILIANRLDISLGVHFVEDGAIIAYTVNEGLSLLENLGLMGVYIPEPIKKAIDVLNDKKDKK